MSFNITGLSAATLSYNGSPYPLPNFNFAWSAGADGIQFLREDITAYYQNNPDEAYTIFQKNIGIEPLTDSVFIVAQDVVGFPESGETTNPAFPKLYYYESQIGELPGALAATLSIQGLRDYFFSQANAFGIDFTQYETELIQKGFAAYIARYAAILNSSNLAKTGTSKTRSGAGVDYVYTYNHKFVYDL